MGRKGGKEVPAILWLPSGGSYSISFTDKQIHQ